MPLLLSCNGCGTSAVVADGADPDAALSCSCCTENHHHGQAANACPSSGYHEGEPCHAGNDGRACVVHTEPGEPCPGEHCGPGVDGCTVCRPITITVLGVTVSPAGGLN